MSKKSDSYYFQNFIECVECGCQAAKMLEDNLNHFDTGLLQDKLDELHRIEHDADKKKHEMMAVLVKAFITPIEREDIILLSQSIDEVTDKIEDVLIRIYINNVQQIRPEALAFIKVIIADSFFRYQKISPERTSLPQLLVQNNVTGGAVMVSRSMLPYLKEIPGVCLMHDAWLALIASCFGEIGWVDRPLYYYRQHGGNTLGAEKGDSLDSVRTRVKDGSSARENYRRMFGQADSFYHMFYSRLNREQQETLEAFIRLPRCGRLGKMGLIVKYGFTKNTLVRTLGQMLFIGD